MSNAEKNAVLAAVAKRTAFTPAGKAKARIGRSSVHVRFCSPYQSAPGKFNINPNTLSADYECWICGSSAFYYLMPISFINGIYNNTGAYVDRMHPEIRIVSVDTYSHSVTIASGGVSSTLKDYLKATLP